MSLKDIVILFKNHQIQYGLNGDSNLAHIAAAFGEKLKDS